MFDKIAVAPTMKMPD